MEVKMLGGGGGGGGLAQSVEHLTENPGAILMQFQVPHVARDFSPRVNFRWRLLQCPYSPCV